MAARAARRNNRRRTKAAPSIPSPETNEQPVAEMIGRVAYPGAQSSIYRARAAVQTIDQTVPDYAYWDQLRRCKLPGYKLGGLFAKRIERVLASWIFGEGINVTLNKVVAEQYPAAAVEYTNQQLANFIGGLLDSGQDSGEGDPDRDDAGGAALLNIFKDATGLGDQYPIINPDGSLSIPSPDTVEVVRDDLDYRHVLLVRIVTKLPRAIITDEYSASLRTITIRQMGDDGASLPPVVATYPVLIGRIPIVHVAHARSANETNGHSIHEELRPLYDQYDDVLEKMLDGVKLLGNPFLAFTGLEDLAAVVDLNKPVVPGTYYDAAGNLVERPAMNIDRNSVFVIGKGGDAKFVAPPVGFTEDTKTALNVLFWLLYEHIGIPEGMWGGELSSARATSETQLSTFVQELRGWQADNGGWVVKLCTIWLQYRALTDPQIVVDRLAAEWPAAIEEDKELLLKFIDLARKNNLLTDETTLKLTELVEDAKAEVEKANAEAKARADEEQARMQAQAAAQGQSDSQAQAKSGAIGEMNGYNEEEKRGIVEGAIRREFERIVAGE